MFYFLGVIISLRLRVELNVTQITELIHQTTPGTFSLSLGEIASPQMLPLLPPTADNTVELGQGDV